MANGKPQLYVLDTNDLNALGALVEVLPLKQGLQLWNKLMNIAVGNKIESKLSSYEVISDEPEPVKPAEIPKAKVAKKEKK